MTSTVTLSSAPVTLPNDELRASKPYGWRYVRSSWVAAIGMSASSSALASISHDLRVGCACATTGATASRLSEKPAATARASGVPSFAVYFVFFAISCMVLPTLWNTTTCATPIG